MATTKQIGDDGEDYAAGYLRQTGHSIILRNYRSKFGEIDIIAMKGGTIIFCEVKRSRYKGESHPELRVDVKKQKRIVRSANQYLAQNEHKFDSVRFDIIAVKSHQGRDIIDHIENAFWPPENWDE